MRGRVLIASLITALVLLPICSARPGAGHSALLLHRGEQNRRFGHGGEPWQHQDDVEAPITLGHTLRRLLQRSTVQQCSWDEATQSCDADDAVNIMYSIKARPASAYLWFLLMTYDRETVCGTYTTSQGCRGDTKHRCIWFDDILDAIGEGSKTTASSNSSSSSSGKSSSGSTSKPAADSGAATPLLGSSAALLMREQLPQKLAFERQLLESMATEEQHQLLAQPFDITPAAAAYMADAASGDSSSSGTGAAGSSSSSGSTGGAGASKGGASKGKRRGVDVMCTSTDMLENYVFTRSKFSNPLQAPLTLHCPGSRAHELVTCMRITQPDACRKNPACVVVSPKGGRSTQSMCVSAYVESLTPQQMKQFMFDLRLAEPSVVGKCDGACWMRQALLCNRTTDAGNCSALSFCRWSGTGTCTPRLYSQDQFGSSVQEYMGECVDVDNKKDCNSLKLSLVNKGTYASWRMPMTALSQCPLPSISLLLKPGSSGRGELASSSRVSMQQRPVLAPVGADEERAAELVAAAAAAQAAAAAAKAAVSPSGRGSASFEVLYISLAEQLLFF